MTTAQTLGDTMHLVTEPCFIVGLSELFSRVDCNVTGCTVEGYLTATISARSYSSGVSSAYELDMRMI